MELHGKVVVVTGGGNGIGRAMVHRFASEGARGLVVADIDPAAAEAVAAEVTGAGGAAVGVAVDVADGAQVAGLVATAHATWGPVDLFCSNAGIAVGGGVEVPDDDWQRIWEVNVLAHVHAARAVLPSMLERGEGYLLQTCSAAGLLSNIGAAPYSVTKHAAVALAEWLAITHGDAGIRVSALCPQGVRTNMLLGGAEADDPGASAVLLAADALEPEEVAATVVAGLRDERFLILPHPDVAEHYRRKADDPDRWLAGMRRLQTRLLGR